MIDPKRVEEARALIRAQLNQQSSQSPQLGSQGSQGSQVMQGDIGAQVRQKIQSAGLGAPQSAGLGNLGAPKQDGFFKTLVKDPIKTLVVKPAVRTAQAGIAGYGVLTGNQRAIDVSTQDVNVHIPVLGKYNIEAQKPGIAGVKQVAGDALKTGAYLYTPGAASGIAAKTALGAIKQGARAGALGAGAYNAGEALQQNKSLKDTTIDAAKGAVAGATIGGVLGGAGVLASKGAGKVKASLQKKAVTDLTEKYNQLFTGTKSGKNAFQKSVNAGKNPSEFLAQNGYILDVTKGKIDAQPVIQNIQQNADSFEEVFTKILQEKDRTLPSDQYINLSRLAQDAKSRLNTPQNKASGNLSKMSAEVDSLVNELRGQFGDRVNLSTLNMIKRGQWAQTKVFDMTKPAFSKDVNYSLGKSALELVIKRFPEADIRAFGRYLGDHYDTIVNLQKLDGKTVNGGRLGKYFARTIGAIAGAKGGPVGSLLGAEAGDTVARIMQSNSIASPVKRAILSQIAKESPLHGEAQAALQKLKLGQLKLPAPTAGSPASSIYLPINQPSKVVTPGTEPFIGTGALSRQELLTKVNDALNEVTPGLSTKAVRKRIVSYVDENGKTQTLKNMSIEDAKDWTAWLQSQGLKYTVKLGGIAALVRATKVGANRSKSVPQEARR